MDPILRQPLPDDVLQRLTAEGTVSDVPAGTVLCRRGEPGNEMHIVKEGQIEVMLLDTGMPGRMLGPGSVVGELAMITGRGTRTATVVTATDCRLVTIDRSHLEDLVRRDPSVAWRALRHACAYLVDSEQALVSDLQGRVVELEQVLDYLRRTKEDLTVSEAAAQTDELTGLYNRRCLHAQLPRLMKRARTKEKGLAALVMDLDDFKPVNDTYGHGAGDVLLRRMGLLLRELARARDLPCRLGGDEFAVILVDVSPDEARDIALRLRKAVEDAESRIPGVVLRVGATIGGTMLRPADDDESLLARADAYLYQAKEAGGNRVDWEGTIVPAK